VQINPRYHVRAKRVGVDGRENVDAIAVEKKVIQKIESLSDIFDMEPERRSLPQTGP